MKLNPVEMDSDAYAQGWIDFKNDVYEPCKLYCERNFHNYAQAWVDARYFYEGVREIR